MTSSRSLTRVLLTAGLPCLVIAGLAGATARAPALALVNESPSLPVGLYIRTGKKVVRGTVVALPQPAAARSYLSALGMPGDVLLIKRVAAMGGDRVCAAQGEIVTPAGRFPVLEHDRSGRSLSGWRGCGVLAPDQVFVVGNTAASFDSRYFGPVKRSATTGVYREILTW